MDLKGKIAVVSGSGNVAQYAVEKASSLWWKSGDFVRFDGFIYDPEGINEEKLAFVMELEKRPSRTY
jgi:glutamate dehydrogenase (NADP+)